MEQSPAAAHRILSAISAGGVRPGSASASRTPSCGLMAARKRAASSWKPAARPAGGRAPGAEPRKGGVKLPTEASQHGGPSGKAPAIRSAHPLHMHACSLPAQGPSSSSPAARLTAFRDGARRADLAAGRQAAQAQPRVAQRHQEGPPQAVCQPQVAVPHACRSARDGEGNHGRHRCCEGCGHLAGMQRHTRSSSLVRGPAGTPPLPACTPGSQPPADMRMRSRSFTTISVMTGHANAAPHLPG